MVPINNYSWVSFLVTCTLGPFKGTTIYWTSFIVQSWCYLCNYSTYIMQLLFVSPQLLQFLYMGIPNYCIQRQINEPAKTKGTLDQGLAFSGSFITFTHKQTSAREVPSLAKRLPFLCKVHSRTFLQSLSFPSVSHRDAHCVRSLRNRQAVKQR